MGKGWLSVLAHLPDHASYVSGKNSSASRQQRLSQLEEAFRVIRPERINGAHVLLVDDVITTGATLEAAATILKRAGAKQVSALVFAQA